MFMVRELHRTAAEKSLGSWVHYLVLRGMVRLGLGLEQGYNRVSAAGVWVRSWTTQFRMS